MTSAGGDRRPGDPLRPVNHHPAGEASDIIQPDSNDICVLPQSSRSLHEQLVLWVSLAHSLSPSQIKHCVAVFHRAVCAVAGGNCAPALGLPSPHLQRSRAGCRADALSTVVVVVEVVVLVLQTLRRTTGPTPETRVDTSTWRWRTFGLINSFATYIFCKTCAHRDITQAIRGSLVGAKIL